jgi:sucrose-phosphate synthase
LIVAGTREDIQDLDKGAQKVFKNILLLIDNYDLYGKVAIPKYHKAWEVPDIYRMVALSRGVFINPALTEPFGLTILEAAASGLPIVATENGGPVDIIANCDCGEVVDPLDKEEIARALLKYLTNAETWRCTSQNGIKGVRKHYSWKAHAQTYLDKLSKLEGKYVPLPSKRPGTKGLRYRDRAIFTDLDQNLIGNPQSLKQFASIIRENRKCVSFGIATGRRMDSALTLIKKQGIPRPDILISSLGTRIHYGQNLTEDAFWTDHIDHDWTPSRISNLLNALPGLKRQPKSEQSSFKISYYYDSKKAPTIDELYILLRQKELTANVILSFGQFLDVVPARASKGQALRYVSQRLEIPLEQTIVAGGSGSDEDMMRGNTLAVVVSNRHHEELSQLDDVDRIYFAGQSHASGILEALEHYDFFDACRVPNDE